MPIHQILFHTATYGQHTHIYCLHRIFYTSQLHKKINSTTIMTLTKEHSNDFLSFDAPTHLTHTLQYFLVTLAILTNTDLRKIILTICATNWNLPIQKHYSESLWVPT